MGMTIKEAESNLHATQAYYNDDTLDSYVGFDKEDNESVDIAISTMRKYQKIERILNWREYDVDPNYHTNEDMINEIREVLEDGNDS